ncbi:hypothetical protein A0130_03205 [Leifsonia xyli]|uniref:hypothetical protein n=1 Tax=Leifsonia xyli TaxID=1575 RepID=UPI0007CDAE6E|nr:hypothetical protein A0130_03205 [Leifsonia xyli]
MDIWADIVATLALIGAAIGFLTARRARKRAEESAILAAKAQSEATDALRRTAEANERLTALWERVTTPPPPRPKWNVYYNPGDGSGFLINVGEEKAYGATVRGYPQVSEHLARTPYPTDVPPQAQLSFEVFESAGPLERIEVSWQDEAHSTIEREQLWVT